MDRQEYFAYPWFFSSGVIKMKLWDVALTGGIVVIAVWYLYRKLVVNRGCTCSSSSSCAAKTKSCCAQNNDSSD